MVRFCEFSRDLSSSWEEGGTNLYVTLEIGVRSRPKMKSKTFVEDATFRKGIHFEDQVIRRRDKEIANDYNEYSVVDSFSLITGSRC